MTERAERWRRSGFLLPVLFSLALLAAIGWGYLERQGRERQEVLLNNERERTFFDLVQHMEEASLALGKTLVAASPGQTAIGLGEVRRLTELAAADVGRLPFSHLTLSRTAQFLQQASDYSRDLVEEVARGRPLADEDWLKLRHLHGEIAELNGRLQEMSALAQRGELRWGELTPKATRGAVREQPPLLRRMGEVDRTAEGFPRLVYDGAFSDEALERPYRAIEGAPVSEEEARAAALRFVPVPEGYEAALVERIENPIPGWAFELRPARGDGPRYRVDVSERGGRVLWFLSLRRPGEPKLALSEGVDRARAFLESHGFPPMEVTNGTIRDRRGIFTFVARSQGILLYPDQVRVAVALDTGRVEGFEGRAYHASHRAREIAPPALSAEDVAGALNPRLRVGRARLALIPRPDGSEVLTYEFRTQFDGEEYLIYVDPETGAEEQILRVVDTEVGHIVF